MRGHVVTDSQSWSKSASIIRERVCSLPEFARARTIVVNASVSECANRSVDEMRRLGGISEVIRQQISALPAEYRLNYGSKLLPRSVVDTLRELTPDLRFEVQKVLAGGSL